MIHAKHNTRIKLLIYTYASDNEDIANEKDEYLLFIFPVIVNISVKYFFRAFEKVKVKSTKIAKAFQTLRSWKTK